MGFNVYVGEGNAKAFRAGPFVDQASADTIAKALSSGDAGRTVQILHNNNAGGKQTSVTSYDKPHPTLPNAIVRGSRNQDNDT